MNNVDEHIKELLISYLCGELDKEGIDELLRWKSLSPENSKYIEDWTEVWIASSGSSLDNIYNKDKAYRSFLHRIARQRSNLRRISRLLPYAAAILLVAIITFYSYRNSISPVHPTLSNIVVEVPMGSRTNIQLPDGTRVWLNAGSKLSYSQDFALNNRRIKLTGEGYFEVTKNKQMPFEINSGNLHVKVLGTKFNFSDYIGDNEAVVTLKEGKVAVNSCKEDESTCYLTPNKEAVYNKTNHTITVKNCNASASKQWTDGKIIFKGDPIAKIVRMLERSYNVHINIANKSLYQNCFYGDFNSSEQRIEEVINALSQTGRLHYRIEGNKVTLY